MLTPEEMLSLAGELTDAAAADDAVLLAAIAWQLYGEAGEDLAEIGRLRAAIHAAWNRPHETPPPRRLPPERHRWHRGHLRQDDAARHSEPGMPPPKPPAQPRRRADHPICTRRLRPPTTHSAGITAAMRSWPEQDADHAE